MGGDHLKEVEEEGECRADGVCHVSAACGLLHSRTYCNAKANPTSKPNNSSVRSVTISLAFAFS